MSQVQCFLMEDLVRIRRFFRRFSFTSASCAPPRGYHNSQVFLDEVPLVVDAEGIHQYHSPDDWKGDPRWPTLCACGYAFRDDDAWQIFTEKLYRHPDGRVMMEHEFLPGAMWRVNYLRGYGSVHWKARGGGPHLFVKLPDGCDWDTDSKASNGDGWTRSGEPPAVTANPSILTPGYHGHLVNGVLISC